MIRFKPLCVALQLEFGYQMHCAVSTPTTQRDREDWYYFGVQGPRCLELAGLRRPPALRRREGWDHLFPVDLMAMIPS